MLGVENIQINKKLECHLHEGRELGLFCSLCSLCLAYNMYSMNIYGKEGKEEKREGGSPCSQVTHSLVLTQIC